MNLLGQYQEHSKEIQKIQNTQDSLTVIRGEKVVARDSIGSIIKTMEEVKKNKQ